MEKITNKNLHTPVGAGYVQVVENENGIVTLEYFSEGKSHMPFVPFSARVMREDTYYKMVKTSPFEAKGKTNKAEKDPSQDKKVRKQADEHPARTVTTSDEVMGYKPDGDYEFIDLRQHDKPKQEVKKQTPVLKGKHKGLSEDLAIDTKYTWGSIEEAIYAAGLGEQEVRAIKMNLFGDEAEMGGIGESQLFREAPEDFVKTEDEYPVDADIDAVDNSLGTSEPTNEVYVGQSVNELRGRIVNLSREEIQELPTIDRGQRIKQVRIEGGEVVKVIPGTILSTFEEGGILYAIIKVSGERKKIKLAQDAKPLLSKGRRSDILYSIRQVQ